MAGGAVAYGATAPGGGMMGHRLERYTIPGMFALMGVSPTAGASGACGGGSWVGRFLHLGRLRRRLDRALSGRRSLDRPGGNCRDDRTHPLRPNGDSAAAAQAVETGP